MEILESDTPLLCEKKELIPDSGGPGKFRGGCGQEIIFKIARKGESTPNPVLIAILAGRLEFPPKGLHGGMPGSVGKLLLNGESVNWGRHFLTNYEDSMTFCLPGGGGFYNPLERDIDCVIEDVKNGLVSAESARRDYGVILDEKSFEVDLTATKDFRKQE
jgi:N-methylhydantoinase B